jgi:DNA-binding CsgD family transcriptional regulator
MQALRSLLDVDTIEFRAGRSPVRGGLAGTRFAGVSSSVGAVSRREADVLQLVGEHLTNAEIAARLYISERTVESHVSSLLRKLDVPDRRQLARHARPPRPAGRDRSLPPAIGLFADPASFVGRLDERDELRRRWSLACDGHTVVAIVSGDAGMGKSRLVAEVALEVHEDGGHVLRGACLEDVDEPYGPFVQAIVDDAAALPTAELRARAGPSAEALARLSPDLARMLLAHGQQPPSDAGALDRGAVVDGIRHWLLGTASTGPLMFVLEDLHWSTATTRDVLRQLVRRAGREPLLIVVTTRDTKPDFAADVSTLVAELEQSPAVGRLTLRGLDDVEVGRLVNVTASEAAAIVVDTGGNPLLVTHMTSKAERSSLPTWLTRRDAMLDEETRALLDVAATFGSEFDADLLAAAHGADLLDVLVSLEAAEAAGLLVPLGARTARFGFVHALFRTHRYEALPPRRRLELHARAARALSTRAGDDRMLSEYARHACLALPLGDAHTAIEVARRAAAHAEHAYAYDEAIVHYRRALEATRFVEPPDAALELDLTIRVAAALHHRGDAAGLPMLLEAARRAERIGDARALVQAALAIPQFGAVGFVDPMPEGRVVTEAALGVLGDEPSPARARLLVDLASHWLFLDVEEAMQIAGHAEAIARQLDDPEVLGAVLLSVRHMVSHPRHLDQRIRVGVELLELGRRLGSLAMSLGGSHTMAVTHLVRGDVKAWRNEFGRFAELLGDRSLGYYQIQLINYHATRAFLDGALDRAEEVIADTVPLSIGIGAGRVFAESMVAANRRLQGRHGELVARFERAAARSSDAWYRCCLAAALARAGRIDDACSRLRQLREEGFPIREIHPWSIAITELAEAAELVGDQEVARYVLDVAGPHSGLLALSGPSVNRPFDQALAQAALTIQDHDAAAAYAGRAVAASRDRGTRVFLVRELVLLAEARRRCGTSDAELRPIVAEARAIAEATGARVAIDDIQRYGLPG